MVDDWKTTRLRNELLNQIDKLIKSPIGKKLGITNPTQFIDMAVRDLLDQYELKRLQMINHHENLIRVLDNDIGPRGDIVELRIKSAKLICSHCETNDCIHAKFVWTDLASSNELKKAGLRSPF